MLEDIRKYVMLRQVKRKAFGKKKWQGKYGKMVVLKIQKNVNESFGWRATYNSDNGYEVKSNSSKFSVLLNLKCCECRA